MKWRKALLIEAGYLDNSAFSASQLISFINSEDAKLSSEETLMQIGGVAYRGIRSEKFIYMEYNSGEIEFYNLVTDPYQLVNVAQSLDSKILADLHAQLEQLKICSAEECRKLEEDLNINLN